MPKEIKIPEYFIKEYEPKKIFYAFKLNNEEKWAINEFQYRFYILFFVSYYKLFSLPGGSYKKFYLICG